ncbi:MAG: ABC transporter ATP-binding protein [bacterium]
MTAPPAILTSGLEKRFGETAAVDGLDLEIPRGLFYGLLGPNGAGKSTTVSMLTGTRRPTRGTIHIEGKPLDPDDPAFKAAIGVVPEEPPLFERLRGDEQLVFTGRMYGLGAPEASRRATDLLELLGLSSQGHTLVVDYSRGMRKKLAIGCALIHAPRLLFFDEPFEGVDAVSAVTIQRVLESLTSRGSTVLLTTHILEVAERICDRVGIIHQGKLVCELDPASLAGEGTTLTDVFRRVVGADAAPPALPEWL